MNTENYRILGVGEDATDEEITQAYEDLKRKYNEEKWLDGEEGMSAARMLGKLDAAYNEIMEERREKRENTSGADAFERVAECIRSGDITQAQSLLDGFNERNAEWHYLQSVVFYKKNWINESKKQLEIAMQMDSTNPKYREAYEKMTSRSQYTEKSGGAPNTNPNPASDNQQMGGNWCANCANMCYTFLCVNCLFNRLQKNFVKGKVEPNGLEYVAERVEDLSLDEIFLQSVEKGVNAEKASERQELQNGEAAEHEGEEHGADMSEEGAPILVFGQRHHERKDREEVPCREQEIDVAAHGERHGSDGAGDGGERYSVSLRRFFHDLSGSCSRG